MELQIKIIVENHNDCFVAHLTQLPGIVVGQGDTYECALADIMSAIHFHIETFGTDILRYPSLEIDK